MNRNSDMPEIDSGMPHNAVRLYQDDAMDDFPVLKAFQRYIDAEQAKARKRLLSLGIFFGVLTGAIIAVFVLLLLNVSERNQELNDRLIEYAMKDRDRVQQTPVVVQQPQDNSAIIALTSKLEEMQKKLDESRVKAERDAAEAAERARREAAEAAKPKGPTPEELEIKRLNALLAAEREKALEREKEKQEKLAAEKELKRQQELEAYRRKHYPEFYGLPANGKPGANRRLTLPSAASRLPIAEEPEDVLDDEDAINYFDDDEQPAKTRASAPKKTASKAPASKPKAKAKPQPETKAKPEPQGTDEPYVIPVEVKGRNSSFRIPEA